MTSLPRDDLGNFIQPGDRSAQSSVMAMVSGTIIFTVSGGPIDILALRSTLVTDNSSLAATFQYKFIPDVGSGQAISGASAALTSMLAGTSIDMVPSSLTAAPVITLAGSGGIMPIIPGSRIRVPTGTLTAQFATSSVTGTFKNTMRYAPLSPDSVVS